MNLVGTIGDCGAHIALKLNLARHRQRRQIRNRAAADEGPARRQRQAKYLPQPIHRQPLDLRRARPLQPDGVEDVVTGRQGISHHADEVVRQRNIGEEARMIHAVRAVHHLPLKLRQRLAPGHARSRQRLAQDRLQHLQVQRFHDGLFSAAIVIIH